MRKGWKYSGMALALLVTVGCATRSSGDGTTSTQGSGCDATFLPYGGGKGTAASPYLICAVAQLEKITDPDYGTAVFSLVSDLDLSGMEPLGSFSATLDGNQHMLSNFGANDSLFQSNSGTIKNLVLKDFQITANTRVGALVGQNESTGTISKVQVTGNLGFVLGYNYHIGGLVGQNLGHISGCSSTLPVTGMAYVGGLVGYNTGTIQKSFAQGAVLSNNSTGGSTAEAGGFVGGNGSLGIINNSYARGNATGSLGNVGGFAGSNLGNCSNVYSTGVATSGASGVGGLVGTNSGTITASYWDTVTSGTSSSAGGTGLTTSQMQTASNFSGWDFITIWSVASGSYPTLR